ncbi:MAG: hypothetical protein HYY16_03030 [Planctomycetes bacterium]|nr:hypothetical protein [Planctomycetota bacterium]
MKADLVAESSAGICALYDPAAVERLKEVSWDNFVKRDGLAKEAKAGNLFSYGLGGDGECKITMYVDEVPPKETVVRAHRRSENLLLKVPSGTLVLTGAEELPFKKKRARGKPSSVLLPRGSYRIDAYLPELAEEARSKSGKNEDPRSPVQKAGFWVFVGITLSLTVGLCFAFGWVGGLAGLLGSILLLQPVMTVVLDRLDPQDRLDYLTRLLKDEPPSVIIVAGRLAEEVAVSGMVGGSIEE